MSSDSSQQKRPRVRRGDGFTIFEVMMATMVMAFAIATSLTVIQFGFRALDNARNMTIAGQLLQSKMEDYRMLPWSVASPSTGSSITVLEATNNNVTGNVSFDSTFTNGDAAVTTMLSRFTVTRNITDVSSTIKCITLTATWNGIDGRSHSLTYSSYYAQNGLYSYFIK